MSVDPSIYENEADFRQAMISYIRQHFGDILGEHASLLDQDGGIDKLAEMVQTGQLGRSI